MMYYTSEVNETLTTYITANFATHLAIISAESGVTLTALKSVEIGGSSFSTKQRRKPYMIVEPVGEDIDDTIAGSVETVVKYDVLIEADGYQEAEALTLVGLYKDAFVSMIMSDDTLGGKVDDASVKNVEQHPGGSGTSKFILMALEMTVSQGR